MARLTEEEKREYAERGIDAERRTEKMTNGEKYKEINERVAKFREFCRAHENCTNCEAYAYRNTSACAYAWEELEYEEELLPCPFCGGDAVVGEYDDEGHDAYTVECTKCECRLMCYQPKREDAIEQWNRRTK